MAHQGGFTEEALKLFQEAASEQGFDFAEGEETYDFTRCVRPDGSAYGTGGRCVKGSQEDKPKEEKTSVYKPPAYNPNPELHAKVARAMARKDGDAAMEKSADAALKKIRADKREIEKNARDPERKKNITDAKARVQEIKDEIKNRGPHTKEEKAELAQQLKVAQNNLKRFESGKLMTREEFQAGLKKMTAKQEEAAKAKSPAVVKEKLSKQEEAMDRLAKEIRSQDGPARYAQIENYKALQREILESRKRLNYGPGYRPDLGGKYKDPNDINKQYDDIKLD